jgi:hypothetical protein
MAMNDYDRVHLIGVRKNWLLWISSFLTVVFSVNNKYGYTELHKELQDYVDWLIAVNSLLVVGYLVAEGRANYIFTKAEKRRRLQYLDNSFSTNFADAQAQNYFSQDNLTPGFNKLAANCFENTFHTFSVLKLMQWSIYRNASIVCIIFFFTAFIGEKGAARTLIEAVLPIVVLQEAVRTAIFITRLETLLESFRSLFSSIRSNGFHNKEPEAMKHVIDYETTLAWASMPTDSDVFLPNRQRLAQEWNVIKTTFQIS